MAGGPAVVAYDPRWPGAFAALRRWLDEALSDLGVRIEHVGSTSVPGLAAKPIIDLDLVVDTSHQVGTVTERLRELGYRHQGDLGIAGREAFEQPTKLPAHHLYLVIAGNQAHRDHIDLRDYLRSNPGAARAYERRKRELAPILALDREAYTRRKGEIVQELLREARVPRSR